MNTLTNSQDTELSNDQRASDRKLWMHITGLCMVWFLMALLVNPIGEFPLNDDWSYSKTVLNLVQHGQLRWGGYSEMLLLPQIAWGAAYCLPFGFSHTALRISCLVAGLIGVLGTFALLWEIRVSATRAFVGAVLVATNPIYFQLSNTFMSDIPTMALSVWAVVFLLRAHTRDSIRSFVVGVLLSCLAVLNKQLAFAVPLGYLLAVGAAYGIRKRTVLRSGIPLLAAGAVFLLAETLVRNTAGLPPLYGSSFPSLFKELQMGASAVTVGPLRGMIRVGFYLGLFLLPLLPVMATGVLKRNGRWAFALTVIFTVIMYIVVTKGFVGRTRMPLFGNSLRDFGLGPLTLHDAFILKRMPQGIPKTYWDVVTFGSALAFATLIVIMGCALRNRGQTGEGRHHQPSGFTPLFAAITAGLYLIPFVIIGFFDRYLLFVVPLLLVVGSNHMKPSEGRLRWISVAGSIFVFLVYLWFTVCATHDYLSWNRTRWKQLEKLTSVEGIPVNRIDGGFEFNAWFRYDPNYKKRPGKSWWWVDDDTYMVSFRPIRRGRTFTVYPFRRWLPVGAKQIVISIRKRAGQGASKRTRRMPDYMCKNGSGGPEQWPPPAQP